MNVPSPPSSPLAKADKEKISMAISRRMTAELNTPLRPPIQTAAGRRCEHRLAASALA